MTLTKEAIIEIIRAKFGFSIHEARQHFSCLVEEIKLVLTQEQDLKISGFGKWSSKNKKPRPGRNPHTGESLQIPGRRVVTFHPSEKLRHQMNTHHGRPLLHKKKI